MDITIYPKKLNGTVTAIPSKSQAHRLLICAALADKPTKLICSATNQDIDATADCLRSLGANITYENGIFSVIPIRTLPQNAQLDCGESGSTLRFLLPVAGALGVDTTFVLHGRLPQRPLSPLWEEMERMGCNLSRPTETTVRCTGKLHGGDYKIAGNVSSQYITGLLLAMTQIPSPCSLIIEGKLESKPYVDMTLDAMKAFGVDISAFKTDGCSAFCSPETMQVEGDWSNAAFFLAAQAMGSDLTVAGLNPSSSQGDRACWDILPNLTNNPTIDASDIPDLVPILAVAAAASGGAKFTNIGRLRLKESDRVASVCNMLKNIGIDAISDKNTMTVFPGQFHGGTVDSVSDHRIAMAAAIAATVADGPVTILSAQCVAKSYPSFWEEYRALGGHYEQYIR